MLFLKKFKPPDSLDSEAQADDYPSQASEYNAAEDKWSEEIRWHVRVFHFWTFQIISFIFLAPQILDLSNFQKLRILHVSAPFIKKITFA